MSDTPETDGITFYAMKGMMPPYNTVPAEFARKLERERNLLMREIQLLLDSTKVETCAEPMPERDGEPADFAGAIKRMRLAEEERNQWRECAEERKKAWYEMQSAFERSRDEVNALERERNKLQEEVERLTAEYRDSED